MSDDREEAAKSSRDKTASDEAERPADDRRGRRGDRPDEPLGDLAAEVRNRTGRGRADERAPGSPGKAADRPDREGPLADVAAAVDERRRERDGDDVDAFDSVEVGELDGEELWERLAEGEDEPAVTAPPEAEDDGEWSDGRDVRTIPKATCHGCPHFGDPPELACNHEGTDILAMPDAEHFRVAGCPMVGDDEEDIGTVAAADREE
ncbi:MULTISPECIES: hypothetical protein [Halorussus]|uniref:hypothetical protein n=1 Tax=Halorussus TaxID=1070314 RepID=UPI001878177C|nr:MULTISPECIES: hypothetical protein [Halorussus]